MKPASSILALVALVSFMALGSCKNRAAVNLKDKDGVTPLMTAARQGDLVRVKALISDGAEVNAMTNTGTTALMEAA